MAFLVEPPSGRADEYPARNRAGVHVAAAVRGSRKYPPGGGPESAG